VKSIKLPEGLRERKAEIEALLAIDRNALQDELADIDRLLDRYSKSTPLRKPTLRVVQHHRRAFQADPGSLASIILESAKRILSQSPRHELAFLELCSKLPRDLAGSSKKRQYVRMTIRRSGRRVGLEYIDAYRVRLLPSAAA